MTDFDVILSSRQGVETVRVTAATATQAIQTVLKPGVWVTGISPATPEPTKRPILSVKA